MTVVSDYCRSAVLLDLALYPMFTRRSEEQRGGGDAKDAVEPHPSPNEKRVMEAEEYERTNGERKGELSDQPAEYVVISLPG